MSVPLFGFVFTLPTVYFKYVSSSMLEGTEVGEVAIGPLSTCAVFILFATLGKVCYQVSPLFGLCFYLLTSIHTLPTWYLYI